MQTIEISLSETAPWQALITRAQVASQIDLDNEVEAYLLNIIYRYVAAPDGSFAQLAEQQRELFEVLAGDRDSKTDMFVVADQTLIFAGLMPEHAIRQQIPLSYFVEVGRYVYREIGDRCGEPLYYELARSFVPCLDVLHTAREIDGGHPCIDPISAYELWANAGSRHAWEYLRRLTGALPGPDEVETHH